jgi:putative oxidoreductase
LFSRQNDLFARPTYRRGWAGRIVGAMEPRPLHRIDAALLPHAGLGPLVLRTGLGLVFLAHGYAKIAVFTLPGSAKYFQAFGLPGWAAYPVMAVELAAGAALLLGFHARLAAAVLVPVMVGALVPHLGNGWMFTGSGGGWEYPALVLVALVAQVFLGAGALAISGATRGSTAEVRPRVGARQDEACEPAR